MTQALRDLHVPRRAARLRLHAFACLGALALAACGSTNDSDKNGNGDSKAGTSGSAAGSSNAGGTSGNAACTATADPPALVDVPAGDFAMGCNEASDTSCDDDEKPQHTVSLSAFAIDRTEVSQAQYTACLSEGACDAPSCEWDCDKADYPAGCLSSVQAKQYCAWAGKRLPTEAEWEKAARGADGAKFPWGDAEPSCTLVNMAGCGDAAKPIGSLEDGASPYGALDMAGNVVEMVADWYDEAYYAASPASDPPGPGGGKRFVGRGGGFKSESKWLRASKRDWYDLTDSAASLGFRCAR